MAGSYLYFLYSLRLSEVPSLNILPRALANNSKCQDNMSLHAQKWSDISGFWSDISFIIVIKILILLGYQAVRSAKDLMSGQSQSFIHVQQKCPENVLCQTVI